MIKKSIAILSITALLTGCSVKNEDSTAEKVAKHTVNSPLYIILGTGMIVETAVRGTLVGGAKAMGAKDKRDEKVTEEVKPSVPQENATPISQEN